MLLSNGNRKQLITVTLPNHAYLQIHSVDTSVYRKIKTRFADYTEGYLFDPRFKAHIWDGKDSLFNERNHTLPSGLWKDLEKYCESENITIEYSGFSPEDFKNKNITRDVVSKVTDIIFKPWEHDLYDYQFDAVYRAIMYQRGIIRACTGSGKSAVIYALIRYSIMYNLKILLIVPTVSLTVQMYGDFKDYGWESIDNYLDSLEGTKSAKIKERVSSENYSKNVVLSTYQSLQTKTEDWFKQFNVLLVDEVHTAKCDSLVHISKACINAIMRIGLTGTMPDLNLDYMKVVGFIGPVFIDIPAKMLIDRGILTPVRIEVVKIRYASEINNIIKAKKNYEKEYKFLEQYTPRDYTLDYILDNNLGKNVLILVKNIDHLERLYARAKERYPEVPIEIVHGKISKNNREKIRLSIDKQENGSFTFATFKTFGTGINVQSFHVAAFFASYKSKYAILQSIGRGLRKHHSKDEFVVYDCVDDCSTRQGTGRIINKNNLYKHGEKRIEMYQAEQFPINISYVDTEQLKVMYNHKEPKSDPLARLVLAGFGE